MMFTTINYKSHNVIIKRLIAILTIFACFGSITTSESIYESQLDTDSFDVENATETIASLQNSINDIIDQLYEIDDKEVNDKGTVSNKYKEIRKEIVNVIQDINKTTEYVSTMISKIALYKSQIQANVEALRETRE
ncbi:hypothetical protein J5751_04545 [bacterium]|nr:hypothetical protein [bacterium]